MCVRCRARAQMDSDQLKWIREEIAIHKRLSHPHICTLHGAFEEPHAFSILLQLCRGGSLCDTLGAALTSGTSLPTARVRSIFSQMVGAVEYCHRHGVVHRDIKLDNLCWADESETHLLLVDFGYACSSEYHASYAGSAHYAGEDGQLLNSLATSLSYFSIPSSSHHAPSPKAHPLLRMPLAPNAPGPECPLPRMPYPPFSPQLRRCTTRSTTSKLGGRAPLHWWLLTHVC